MILATAPIELWGIWIQSPPTLALRATGFVLRVSRWEICAWHSLSKVTFLLWIIIYTKDSLHLYRQKQGCLHHCCLQRLAICGYFATENVLEL